MTQPAASTAAPAGTARDPRRRKIGGLTPKQADRHQRILDVALELAAERGTPDAIQIREIAERSNVGLGTLYRYYSSKEQVLAAAILRWARAIKLEPLPKGLENTSVADRAVAMIRRATAAVERESSLARMQFLLVFTASPPGRELARDLTELLTNMIEEALAGMETSQRLAIQRVLGHVWTSAFLGWTNGLIELSEVGNELEFVCRWLITGDPSKDS